MTEKIKNNIRDRQVVAWCLVALVFSLAGLYLYFVSKAVYSVVARQSVERQADVLEGEVEELQARYIALKSEVTEGFAAQKGFAVISPSKFISRKTLGKALSMKKEI